MEYAEGVSSTVARLSQCPAEVQLAHILATRLQSLKNTNIKLPINRSSLNSNAFIIFLSMRFWLDRRCLQHSEIDLIWCLIAVRTSCRPLDLHTKIQEKSDSES